MVGGCSLPKNKIEESGETWIDERARRFLVRMTKGLPTGASGATANVIAVEAVSS